MSTDAGGVVAPQETAGGDRVREHTDPDRLAVLDRELRERVAEFVDAPRAVLTRRLTELEHESDMERILEMNASALALTGLIAGVFGSRRFLIVPAVVLGFLLQHAVQGWCPPVVLFRRLGVRTRQEIDAEKFALKALRGDFDGVRHAADRGAGALEASGG
jgi:hypothetical protein